MIKTWVEFLVEKASILQEKNWIKDAVNPQHRGFCTPESKSTCTPKRKALAKTFKKMAKKKKKK
jgi:hypothetical protein